MYDNITSFEHGWKIVADNLWNISGQNGECSLYGVWNRKSGLIKGEYI